MFSQNQEEVKLEWMYKGPHSTVDREEYLLGRAVDKTLEQVNVEEKQQLGITQSKNHVEHECIPPSIREYKQQCGEQVDITTKLQEDPLIAIKKQEEEKRRQFLNNPVQIKKLQKALKAQKKKMHQSSNCDKDLDTKLVHKLQSLRDGILIGNRKSKKLKGGDLDVILMHKYNQLKSKLSDNDIRQIFEGSVDSSSSSSDSSSHEDEVKHEEKQLKRSKDTRNFAKRKYNEICTKSDDKSQKRSRSISRDRSGPNQNRYEKQVSHKNADHISKFDRDRNRSYEHKDLHRKSYGNHTSHSSTKHNSSNESYSSSSDSDTKHPVKKNWGLVKADGTKIPLTRTNYNANFTKLQTKSAQAGPSESRNRQRLTEEEKHKRRQEMLVNASWRERERSKNLEVHRKKQLKEDEERKLYDPKFLQKELIKSANSGSVESRIKANINNIQRSGNDMNKNFSRR